MSIIAICVAGALLLLVIAYGLGSIPSLTITAEDNDEPKNDEPVLYTDILDSERPYYEQFY